MFLYYPTLKVAGSSPACPPFIFWGSSSVGRAVLHFAFLFYNLAKNVPVSLTFNQRVVGSSPTCSTLFKKDKKKNYAKVH